MITHILKAITVLFNSVREHLILQQEWLIQFLVRACESGIVGWDIEDWSMAGNGFDNDKKNNRQDSTLSKGSPPDILAFEVRELYLETLLQVFFILYSTMYHL